MNILFNDLKTPLRRLEAEIRAGIDRVLEHGRFIMGPEVGELESALAAFVGVEHAVSCSSGTDALLLALMAHDIGPGDAVFTTPFTFVATAEVIALLRATPVFADIDPRTFTLDPAALERAIAEVKRAGRLRPRAVIPVDIFGVPADHGRIGAIAGAESLVVIEDAAQSFGATCDGRRAGALGDAAATSFFPAKPLGCCGDGGAVFTSNDALARELRSIRVHGKGADKYDNVRIGLNARLDSIQAAILLARLGIFPGELAARRHIAAAYTERLRGAVETPLVPPAMTSAWAQYSVLLPRAVDREEVIRLLAQEGVPAAVYYRRPLHLQPAFAGAGFGEGSFPVAESVSRRILSLPMHPYLEEDEIDHVTGALRRAILRAGDRDEAQDAAARGTASCASVAAAAPTTPAAVTAAARGSRRP